MKFMFAKFKNEIVQFLLNEDIEDKEDGVKYHAVSYISKYNRLDLCEIVYSETELFNRIHDSLDLAAEFGNLEVVEFLTRKGVSCSTNAMDFGATNGHLHVIQWLHENRFEGCSAKAMSLAAGCGHLDVVQWLHKNRSERCSSYAIIDAASNSHIEVVKYLIENGIVSDQNSFRFSMNVAKKQGKTEIVSYLESVLK